MPYSQPNSTAPPIPNDLDENDDTLENIFPKVPRPSKSLLIFDGTANQKVPILMWMGEQVSNSLRKALAKTKDDRKKFYINQAQQEFNAVFREIRTTVYDVTESTSPFTEDQRKETIEKFARVIRIYRIHLERILDEDSYGLSPQLPPILQNNLFRQQNPNNRPHSQPVTTPIQPTAIQLQLLLTPRKPVPTQTQPVRISTQPPPTPAQEDTFEIPRAAVPMTRILGMPKSPYVSPKPKGVKIHERAYADNNRKAEQIPFKIDLNETYEETLQGVPKNLTYVGAMYPDGSSLSYLPIKGITLIRQQSFVQYPTQDEGGLVELKIPKVIYDKIKDLCSEAYLSKYPDHVVRYPFEQVLDSRTIKIQALARGYRRLRIVNGPRIYHVTLLKALEGCSHDLLGDGLLHLRFDRPNSDDHRATMKLIFFGLQMVRNSANHFQKIFRI